MKLGSRNPRRLGVTAILVAAAFAAGAADLQVTNNDDSGTGSLREVLESAGAGDVITFAPSFDDNAEIMLDSSIVLESDNGSAKPVFLDASGRTVVINHENYSFTASAFRFRNGASGYTLRGIEVKNAKSHAFALEDCSDIALEQVVIADPADAAIFLDTASDITVDGCTISGCDFPGAISNWPVLDTAANAGLTVANCYFYGNRGTSAFDGSDILINGMAGVLIEDNVFGISPDGMYPNPEDDAALPESAYAVVLRGYWEGTTPRGDAEIRGNTIRHTAIGGVFIGGDNFVADRPWNIHGNSITAVGPEGAGKPIQYFDETEKPDPQLTFNEGEAAGNVAPMSAVSVFVDLSGGENAQCGGFIGSAVTGPQGLLWDLTLDAPILFPGLYVTATAVRGGTASEAEGAATPLPGTPLADADGDYIPDVWEAFFGLSTDAATGMLGDDGAFGDPDGDDATNMEEYIADSDPLDAGSTPDAPSGDQDGIPNYVEGDGDPDGDGLPNWRDPDSDGDGIEDAVEAGADPSAPVDSDADGTPDYLDTDSDDDGLDDADEGAGDPDADGIPNYLDLDSDGDTIPDAQEAAAPEGTDPDGDGVVNWLDLDSDDDGFSDEEESLAGSNPYDAASKPLPLSWGLVLAGFLLAILAWIPLRVAKMRTQRVNL